MDFIRTFGLGQDVAWTLLGVIVLGLAAIALGVVLPPRLAGRRAPARTADDADVADVDEDGRDDVGADETDPEARQPGGLAARLGSLISAASAAALVVGVPVALLLLLVPGTFDGRLLRAAMVLAGILAGVIVAWRTAHVALALEDGPLSDEARRRALPRVGSVLTATAIAVPAVVAALAVFFLRADAGSALIGFAAGLAVVAVTVRVIGSFADMTALSAALLVGAEENELPRADSENPGAVHVRAAELLRAVPGRAVDVAAVTAALVALGTAIGVAVFAVEGILVPLLGVGVALAVALLVCIVPHLGASGRGRETLRLGSLICSVLGAGALSALVVLWLPGAYKQLRFAAVGLGKFTDPALTGGQAVDRAQLEPQIEQARQQIGQAISQLGDGAGGRSVLDTVAIYGVHPGAVAAIAVACGAVLTLIVQALMSFAADRRNTPALSAARTARTGGALGLLAALGSGGALTCAVIALLAVTLAAIGILGAGITMLTAWLTVCAGLGALVVVAGHAALSGASWLGAPRPDALAADDEQDPAGERAEARALLAQGTSGSGPASGAGLRIAMVLAALGALAPLTNAVFGAAHATTLWEDRMLTDMSPSSLLAVGAFGLGIATVVLVASGLLEGLRRLAAAAVIDTRAALLEGGSGRVDLAVLDGDCRRSVAAVAVIAVIMPVLAGFGLGAAALPAYVTGVVIGGAALALWSTLADAPLAGALDVVEGGRYGGRGSWAHAGLLSGRVLSAGVQGALGRVAMPAALLSALVASMLIGAVISMSSGQDSYYLRWLVAVGAAIIVIGAHIVATTSVPEPDLEDSTDDLEEPLFARTAPPSDEPELLSGWEDEDAAEERPARRGRRRRGSSAAD